MAIKHKSGGAYTDVAGVFHKRAGTYEAVQGIYAKAGGVYGRVDAAPISLPIVSLFRADSYSSGQVWANTVATPADGATTSEHDWLLGRTSGAEASDPVHTSGDRWVFTNGDRFTLAASPRPAYYQNMHHLGRKFSLLFRISYDGTAAGQPIPLFDSGTGDYGGAYTSRGVAFCDLSGQFGPTHKVKLYVGRDSGGDFPALAVNSDDNMPTGGVHVVGISFDSTGAVPSFFFLDGAYMKVGGSDTFSGALAAEPGTLISALAPTLGGRADGFGFSTQCVQLYGGAFFDSNLSIEEMSAAALDL